MKRQTVVMDADGVFVDFVGGVLDIVEQRRMRSWNDLFDVIAGKLP